jgi:hypothetical protein
LGGLQILDLYTSALYLICCLIVWSVRRHGSWDIIFFFCATSLNSAKHANSWEEHLTRFPGKRFILARGRLDNRDLPGFNPPGRHLVLFLEASKAAHLLPTVRVKPWIRVPSPLLQLVNLSPSQALSRTHRPICRPRRVDDGSTGGG